MADEPLRVLICDDEPGMRLILGKLVGKAEGFEVVGEAENGEQALEMFEKTHPQVVFLDVEMPVMDGVTATRLIRQSSRPDHDIPIFAMTANTFASDRRRCREAGMNGYIPKPVSVKNSEEALTVIEK